MSESLTKIICGDEIKYFTQFNVGKTINMPCMHINYKNDEIDSVAKVKVYTTKIIDTCEGTSIEGQCLTGKKLIVLGSVNIKLLIPYWCYGSKEGIKDVRIDFSTFIIIPKEICRNQKVNLRYLLEDVTAKAITSQDIFVSVTVLLQFTDEYIDDV